MTSYSPDRISDEAASLALATFPVVDAAAARAIGDLARMVSQLAICVAGLVSHDDMEHVDATLTQLAGDLSTVIVDHGATADALAELEARVAALEGDGD